MMWLTRADNERKWKVRIELGCLMCEVRCHTTIKRLTRKFSPSSCCMMPMFLNNNNVWYGTMQYRTDGMSNWMSKKLWALSLDEKWGKRTQMFVLRKMTIVVTCPPWVNANHVTSVGTEKKRPWKYLALQEWHHTWNCSNQKNNMSLLVSLFQVVI